MNLPDPETPLWKLTVGEFTELITETIQNATAGKKDPEIHDFTKKEYVYGLDGLAKLFGCSKTTAWKIKKSGELDNAISQRGRQIIIDKELAIEIYRKSNYKFKPQDKNENN